MNIPAPKALSNESAGYRAYQFAKMLRQKHAFTVALWTVYGDYKEVNDAMDALARDIMAVVDALP
jgi:hypothetical protein